MDIFGPVVLFVVLIVFTALQAAAVLGAMYLMHMKLRDKLTETKYGQFDLDNFQKPALMDVIVRLCILFAVPTLVLHMAEYFLFGPFINKYRFSISFGLFVLQSAAIVGGYVLIFRLDKFRLMVLSGASIFVYLLILWYLVSGSRLLI